MKSPTASVFVFRSRDIILVDFSHTLLVLHAMFRMQMNHYLVFLPVAVPTAEAVATAEVKCYNFIVRLRSLPRYAETISQGYYY